MSLSFHPSRSSTGTFLFVKEYLFAKVCPSFLRSLWVDTRLLSFLTYLSVLPSVSRQWTLFSDLQAFLLSEKCLFLMSTAFAVFPSVTVSPIKPGFHLPVARQGDSFYWVEPLSETISTSASTGVSHKFRNQIPDVRLVEIREMRISYLQHRPCFPFPLRHAHVKALRFSIL